MMAMPRFQFRRRLKTTLYGETLLCEDTFQCNKLVVLKHIDLSTSQKFNVNIPEDPFRELQVIEVLKTSNGQNNHIVKYEDEAIFFEANHLFIAMEYCSDNDLYDYVEGRPDGRLNEVEALYIFRQIAFGVQYLHYQGIAHRDLSLENVLLHQGQAKLCDFGLSTNVHNVCSDHVGKLYYMAPEIVRGIKYRPAVADIWSLGIMLFILLTGSPLIADENLREAVFCVLEIYGIQRILEMWGMNNSFRRDTIDLLTDMLQVNPTKRISINDVLNHPALRLPL